MKKQKKNKHILYLYKAKIIKYLIIFMIVVFVGVFLMFLPFIDGESAFDNIVAYYRTQKATSRNVVELVFSFLLYIIVIWSISLRILETTLIYHKWKKELSKKDGEIMIFKQKKLKVNVEIQDIDKVEEKLTELSDLVYKISGVKLTSITIFESRDVLKNKALTSNDKRAKILGLLVALGVSVENKELNKFLKNI